MITFSVCCNSGKCLLVKDNVKCHSLMHRNKRLAKNTKLVDMTLLIGRDKDSGYPHDGRADKNPYPHDRRADKDSYPHDSNNQCIILRLQLSFVMINEQMMLV